MTYLYIKDYSWFYESLTLIKSKYKAPILRKLKSEIYDLVLTNEPNQSLQVINLEDDKLDDLEVVVGVGVIKDFAEKGYEGVSVREIYEDIVFDNKNFDPMLIVEKALPTLLRRHNNSIPIYKYIRYYESSLPEQIEKEKKTKLKHFLNKGLINRRKTVNLEQKSVKDIADNFDLPKSLEYICLLDEENININELCDFLQKTFNANPDILNIQTRQIATNFRRIVKIYDFLKYK